MDKIIEIETTRYSALFRRTLGEYGPGAEVRIDGRSYGEGDIEGLLSGWCTNGRIRRTRDFELIREGRTLFRFHDGPDELFAAYSELAFVERLRAERIVRYHIGSYDPGRPSLIGLPLGRAVERIRGIQSSPKRR
jgi:hypothetical protein